MRPSCQCGPPKSSHALLPCACRLRRDQRRLQASRRNVTGRFVARGGVALLDFGVALNLHLICVGSYQSCSCSECKRSETLTCTIQPPGIEKCLAASWTESSTQSNGHLTGTAFARRPTLPALCTTNVTTTAGVADHACLVCRIVWCLSDRTPFSRPNAVRASGRLRVVTTIKPLGEEPADDPVQADGP